MPRGIPSSVIDHFRAIPLFSSASKKGIRALIQASSEVDVRAGRLLVREGGFDRDLFVITRGEAGVTRGGRRIATLGPGDFFGEMALLARGPRMATVTAATDMRVVVLGPRQMEEVIQREPSLAKPMLEAMARRIRRNERTF